MLLKLLSVRPEWSAQDSAELREFLNKNGGLGQKFFNSLLFSRPDVTGYDPEQRRVQSDERSGYEACLAEMIRLSDPTDKNQTND
jgi:hypothetical protein